MGFIEEINSFFGCEEIFSKFKATLFGNKAIYFENVKELKSFSQQKVELRLKEGEISVEGEGLCIKKYCIGDVAITGRIKSIVMF